MTPLQELESAIRTALPRLNDIEVGQRFERRFIGEITATKLSYLGKNEYVIYGYDTEVETIISYFYPSELTLLGKRILLSDVLEWMRLCCDKNYFVDTDGDFAFIDTFDDRVFCGEAWNFSLPYLDQQSPETINWLHSLIKPQ